MAIVGVLLVTIGMTQPSNNICQMALELTIDPDDGCFETGQFSINEATPSSVPIASCVDSMHEELKDIWFRFPAATNDLRVALNVPLVFEPLKTYTMSIYRGSCDQLEELACLQSSSDAFNVLAVDNLIKGEEVFLRLSTPSDSMGSFQVCLIFYPDGTADIDCDEIVVHAPRDTMVDLGTVIDLFGHHEPVDLPMLYEWYVGDSLLCIDCKTVAVAPKASSTYTVAVSYAACIVQDETTIDVELIDDAIYVPNAFTPNGDNRNDRFRILGGPKLEAVLELNIYDRWGSLVYRNEENRAASSSGGWDGTLGGRELDEGTFIYWAKVRLVDGSLKDLHGSVLLLR